MEKNTRPLVRRGDRLPHWNKISTQKFPSKFIYWELIDRVNPVSGTKLKWEKELKIDITDEEWKGKFTQVFSVTNSIKLRMFQFQIISQILTTNVLRSKYTQEISDKCYYCNLDKETTFHLFVQCKEVKKLWKLLGKWCRYFLNCDIEFTPKVIIFNDYRGQKAKLINLLVLIMKQYIYVTKCKEEQLVFIKFISYVFYIKRIEWLTALRNHKITKHYSKWQNVLE